MARVSRAALASNKLPRQLIRWKLQPTSPGIITDTVKCAISTGLTLKVSRISIPSVIIVIIVAVVPAKEIPKRILGFRVVEAALVCHKLSGKFVGWDV